MFFVSFCEITSAVGPPHSVCRCLERALTISSRAPAAEITWEIVNELNDNELEARLFQPVAKETTRPKPDFYYVKPEFAKRDVTL